MNRTQYRTMRRFAKDNGNRYALRHAAAIAGDFAAMEYNWILKELESVDALAERAKESQRYNTPANVFIRLWPQSSERPSLCD